MTKERAIGILKERRDFSDSLWGITLTGCIVEVDREDCTGTVFSELICVGEHGIGPNDGWRFANDNQIAEFVDQHWAPRNRIPDHLSKKFYICKCGKTFTSLIEQAPKLGCSKVNGFEKDGTFICFSCNLQEIMKN